jgi:hypothetical protein
MPLLMELSFDRDWLSTNMTLLAELRGYQRAKRRFHDSDIEISAIFCNILAL